MVETGPEANRTGAGNGAAIFVTLARRGPPDTTAPQFECPLDFFSLFFLSFNWFFPIAVATAPVGVAIGVGESSVWRCRRLQERWRDWIAQGMQCAPWNQRQV